jgi:microcystin-dependent protein
MSEPFVGEIRMFAGNFAPRGWALCDGQLLDISQNDALFSLLGTTYGGDGRTTFGLPDMRGRIPIHAGTGPGLSPRAWGAKAGQERVTLTTNQLPSHSHPLQVSDDLATTSSPQGTTFHRASGDNYIGEPGSPANLNAGAIGTTGGGQDHNNVQPFLCLNFIIALFGIYPSRN